MSNYWKNRLKNWRNEPYVMYLFLAVQLLVFLCMELFGLYYGLGLHGSESVGVLMKFGAITWESVVIRHEWWRLITPIFVHIGFLHVLMNSVTLYYLGQQIEGLFGHWRFFVMYLLSGILGNAMSLGLGRVNSVSAGASTSLFGLCAIFLVLGRLFRYNPAVQAMARSMGMFIVMNLLFNLFFPNVDILGHLGGILGGLITTYIVGVPTQQGRVIYANNVVTRTQRIGAIVLYIVLLGVFLLIAFRRFSGISHSFL